MEHDLAARDLQSVIIGYANLNSESLGDVMKRDQRKKATGFSAACKQLTSSIQQMIGNNKFQDQKTNAGGIVFGWEKANYDSVANDFSLFFYTLVPVWYNVER